AHYDKIAPPEWLRESQRVFYGLDQWCAIVAALSFARQWNPADSRPRRPRTEAISPFYIVHQTAIVLLAHFMKPLGLRPLVEGPLLVAATLAICFASFEIVRRVGWMRPLFGLAAAPRAVRAFASSEYSAPRADPQRL